MHFEDLRRSQELCSGARGGLAALHVADATLQLCSWWGGGGLQGTCILSCGCRAELFGLQAFCKFQEICL